MIQTKQDDTLAVNVLARYPPTSQGPLFRFIHKGLVTFVEYRLDRVGSL